MLFRAQRTVVDEEGRGRKKRENCPGRALIKCKAKVVATAIAAAAAIRAEQHRFSSGYAYLRSVRD